MFLRHCLKFGSPCRRLPDLFHLGLILCEDEVPLMVPQPVDMDH
jgi:hypothetical protein